MRSRIILHLDMDAFYPAVEILDHPELAGRPVIVGGLPQRGVVASASYEARRFGIHSAQPMAEARRRCPQGVFLPPRMARYKAVSRQILRIFESFSPLVEPLSIDEAFLDVTGCERLFGTPRELAARIKAAVRHATGLTVSAGAAPSKFVAKIASDLEKPDGLVVVPPEEVSPFLDPLGVQRMWSVGPVTARALEALGIRTMGQLRRMPPEFMTRRFGRNGLRLRLLAQGIDPREVLNERQPKSVGHEVTFVRDLAGEDRLRRELLGLAEKVARRLRQAGLNARTLTLKIRYPDFQLVTRAVTLPNATSDAPEIYRAAWHLFVATWRPETPLRLLGLSVSSLSPLASMRQLLLFEQDRPPARQQDLHAALDRITARFGPRAIRAGSLAGSTEPS